MAYDIRGTIAKIDNGTSVFDPALCETLYAWFCPPTGHVLDPFAGGSVRGIVAAYMGRKYTGVDIRAEQVAANRQQAADITPENPPVWHCGDSLHIRDIAGGCGPYDFLMSCPPYGNLEVYSDEPGDISNMADDDFAATYAEIIANACGLLAQDAFAAFVVGNYRDKRGAYVDLCGLTVQAFKRAGLAYYNEIVLLNAIGSAAARCNKQFTASRKVAKVHQNVLVFVKGDAKRAALKCRGTMHSEVIVG